MALAFTFLQHGSPCIYYGTEIGMTGENDPDCRKCMVWEEEKQDQAFLSFTKELVGLRKAEQAVLSLGSLDFISCEDDQSFVGFERIYNNTKLTAYFNRGTTSQELKLADNGTVLLAQDFDEKEQKLENKGFVVIKETI